MTPTVIMTLAFTVAAQSALAGPATAAPKRLAPRPSAVEFARLAQR